MSSILKALKKIEEVSGPPEPFPSLAKAIDSKQPLNSNTEKRRRFRRTLTFIILLLAVVVAAVIFYSQRRIIIAKLLPPAATEDGSGTVADTSQKKKISQTKIRAESEKSARRPSAETRPPKNQKDSAVTDSIAKKFQAAKPSYTSEAAANQRESISSTPRPVAEAELKAKVIKPLKKTPPLPRTSPDQQSVIRKDNAPNEPAGAAAKKPTRTQPKITYDRIEDSKLKLQALAWSDDDARRMAVINGRIVREGESVDGYQVVRIREEDVVVNDGGKSWRLEFGLQQ